jgi:FkbM family methyltransferase
MDLKAHLLRFLPQFADIGSYRIRLPYGSRLNLYQSKFRRYDMALGEIASLANATHVDLHAIDIGANVGDTAALIRKYADVPVLCIEGDARLLPILRANCVQMGPRVEIEPSFVGKSGTAIDAARIGSAGLNASLVHAVVPAGSAAPANATRMSSMSEILARHPTFARARLLKIDTEGFDFDIIGQSVDFLSDAKPILFFEYAPTFRPDTPDAGPETLRLLASLGYTRFLFYDNYGNFLLSVTSENIDQCDDLHAYLLGNATYGPVVHYFDICAFHAEDLALAEAVRQHARGLPTGHVRQVNAGQGA